MKDIEYQTKNLVITIKKSNEYNQYQRLYTSIASKDKVLERLNEFRRRNFELQLSQETNSLEVFKALKEEYRDVLRLPTVQEFLIVEQRINAMLRNINHYLLDNIELNVDFL